MANAPTISLSGVIVTVSTVEGAMGYRLYVDGEQISETAENEFDLSSLLDGYATGDYTITATAYFDNDIDPITETDQSNAITYTISETSDAPTINLSGAIITVSVVEGAMGYRLYVDNSMIEESMENEFDLSVILDGYPIGSYAITATGYFDNDIDPITETAQSNAITYTIEEPQPVEEKYTIKKSTLSGIADAIRSKTGKSYLIDAANFASEIESIQTEEPPALEELTATENGEYTPPIGIDGFSKVTVRVPGEYLSFVNASTGQSRTISGVAISDDAISFVSVSHEVTAAESN